MDINWCQIDSLAYRPSDEDSRNHEGTCRNDLVMMTRSLAFLAARPHTN